MGIEPFLLIFIVLGMFFLQGGRVLQERIGDRLWFSRATRDGVRALAARRKMLTDGGSWRGDASGVGVHLQFDRYPGRRIRHTIHRATGVWQRRTGAHQPWLAPSILVLVRLDRPLGPPMRLSQRPSVVASADRIQLQDPVLDQLLRVSAADAVATRHLLRAPGVQAPLLEILGRYPLSVVTEEVIAVWCVRAVADPEPLVHLALELATALTAAAPGEATAPRAG